MTGRGLPLCCAPIGRGNGLWRSVAVGAAVLVTVDLLYTFVPLWAIPVMIAL